MTSEASTVDNLSSAPRTLWLALSVLVGSLLRFVRLSSLPIFNDEAIYGHWLQLIQGQNWLVSFSDGKLPLFYWVSAVVARIINNPVLGLRIVAATSGVIGILGLYKAGSMIWDARVGLAAAWIYAVIPYVVFNNRLGLADSLVAAIAPFILVFGIKLGQKPSLLTAFYLFFFLTLAFLTKATATALILPAFVGIYIGARLTSSTSKRGTRAKPWVYGSISISLAVAILFAAIKIGRPLSGDSVIGKSSSFLLSIGEFADFPVSVWQGNIGLITSWFTNYLQWPAIIIIIVAIVLARKKMKWTILIFLGLGVTQVLIMGAVAKILISRYLMVTLPALVLATALATVGLADLASGKRSRAAIVLLILTLLTGVAARQDILLISKPTQFAWTSYDRWQYIEGWPSGYGFLGVVEEVEKRIRPGRPLKVYVDQTLGYPRDGLRMFFAGKKGVEIILISETEPLPTTRTKPEIAYLAITDSPRIISPGEFMKINPKWAQKRVFNKPGKMSAFRLYEKGESK